eukprot:TRINITY_DN1263_c0_g1_i8.p1 TRINITY_DN1263_c0_g1~~TRINITY_DN1263_c0_g1_i8.p1  ORF type:complete len:131 (+),score=16.08 TRINITY_DN1263_c0_g1_i8:166-558(+)
MFRAIARSSRGVWRNTQNARVVPIASQPWRDFHVPGQHRKLGDVVHLDLLVNESTNRIIEIWRQYHAAKKDTVAAGMPTNKWDMFKQRTQERLGGCTVLNSVAAVRCSLSRLLEAMAISHWWFNITRTAV